MSRTKRTILPDWQDEAKTGLSNFDRTHLGIAAMGGPGYSVTPGWCDRQINGRDGYHPSRYYTNYAKRGYKENYHYDSRRFYKRQYHHQRRQADHRALIRDVRNLE